MPTERRVVFIKDGRETDSPPVPPMQTAPPIKRASTEQDEHVAAPGLLGRVMARDTRTLGRGLRWDVVDLSVRVATNQI
jgi:hypothetical protein